MAFTIGNLQTVEWLYTVVTCSNRIGIHSTCIYNITDGPLWSYSKASVCSDDDNDDDDDDNDNDDKYGYLCNALIDVKPHITW